MRVSKYLVSAVLVAACGNSEDAASSAELNSGTANPSGDSFLPGAGNEDILGGQPGSAVGTPAAPAATPVPALPPEMELSFEFELPQAGKRYVFAANPKSDSVAVIDAETLAIQAVEAGDQPTFLRTLAGSDAAIVLNVGSSDATIIRTQDGTSATTHVPVQQGANAIAVAPDGKHAVVYFDATHRGAGVTGSYQDISVVFLGQGDERAVAMTVGFRPSTVSFSEDGSQGFVVTEDGVSILDFEEIRKQGAHIAKTVPLGADATASLDVSVTPDGAYALARREGESQLRLADLDTGDVHLLDLATLFTPEPQPEPELAPQLDAGTGDAGAGDGGTAVGPESPMPAPVPTMPASPEPAPLLTAITDVDLAPSGAFALAVVRDQSTVLQVPIPSAFTSGAAIQSIRIDDEVIGSVSISPDSGRALLYTTVVSTNERITILDVASEEFDVIRLPKSVESVTIAPDSQTALIIHQKLDGSPDEPGLDPDTVIDRQFGYSVLELDSGFSKLQTASSRVGPSTVVPGGSALFVLFNEPSVGMREVHQVHLESFLVERIVLGSPPTSIGSVPDSKKVFVGQDHRDGRIAFIDWETGDIESVTGFELNSRIRE